MSISVFTNSSDEVAAAIENPCRKDCERRCGGCHARCPEYLEYQEYKQKEYENRARAGSMKGPTPGKQARIRQASREKRGGYRHRRG